MTEDPQQPLQSALEGSVGYYLSRARNVLLHRMDAAVGPLGLTPQQIGVMFQLSLGLARTPQELSRALAYDSGSMTRMLDRLEAKGLIRRTRSAPPRSAPGSPGAGHGRCGCAG